MIRTANNSKEGILELPRISANEMRMSASVPPDRQPGIYADRERRFSDDQILAIALTVKSSPRVWSRFSKITDSDGLDDELYDDVRGIIRDYVISNSLVMAGPDFIATIRLLRAMANKERSDVGSSSEEQVR